MIHYYSFVSLLEPRPGLRGRGALRRGRRAGEGVRELRRPLLLRGRLPAQPREDRRHPGLGLRGLPAEKALDLGGWRLGEN